MTGHLDRLLNAVAPDPDLPQPRYDLQAGRQYAAERLAAHAAGLPAAAAPGVDRPDRDGLSFHDHAERDLTALATLVLHQPGAYDWLSSLEGDRIDPRGGLVFACLLHLTGQPFEAQWWWQFAAGAGDCTATYCLYLHHIRLGEMRDAEHWFDQAARLEAEPGMLPPTPPTIPGYFRDAPWVCQYLPGPDDLPAGPDHALRESLGNRQTLRDDMCGSFSLPPENIADHLLDLVGN
ncbi:hypothetical protein [Kitasatospora sp. NPDC002040]|uniref:hypothetical protein n=1 Tax=Kitasatospora sp. NPDC002040 TaxID=3154661 RepID=UPI003322CA55